VGPSTPLPERGACQGSPSSQESMLTCIYVYMLSCLHAYVKHVILTKIKFEQFGDFEAIFESGNLMRSVLKEGIKKIL
jgi:hypothetical protein